MNKTNSKRIVMVLDKKRVIQDNNYHLSEHVYASKFRDEFILLDAKQDKYIICSNQLSELLLGLVGGPYSKSSFSPTSDKKLSDNKTDLEMLISNEIIEKKAGIYPYYIDQKTDSHGVSNVDWRLPLDGKKAKLNLPVLEALITLVKVHFCIQIRGFYRAIQLIKKAHKIQSNYIIPTTPELDDLARIVNKACIIYPKRTKCLEWAMTFVLLALKRKWKCNLEIGVQNYPFMAHAWVECDGKLIMDSEDLREGMAIILNEPFRRLKI